MSPAIDDPEGAMCPAWMRIRRALPADADTVLAMAAELSRTEGQFRPRWTRSDYIRDGFGPQPAFSVLLAERVLPAPCKVVGYLLHYPGYDVGSATRGCHLADLFVDQHWRRRGVASALLRSLAATQRNDNGAWISWLAFPANRDATAFYDAIGAKRVSAIVFDLDGAAMDHMIDRRPARRSR